MIKLARIVQINTTSVVLQLQQNSECSDCSSKCSEGLLSFLFNKKDNNKLTVSLDSQRHDCHLVDNSQFFNESRKVNDVVGISFDETYLFQLSLVLYGLPIFLVILCLISGYFLLAIFGYSSDIGGLIGFALGLVLSRRIIKSKIFKLQPQVKFFN